jgi:PhnB protein
MFKRKANPILARTLMQVYVKGSVEAVALYQKAFDAKLGLTGKNADGTYMHAELDVYGQIVAISEADDKSVGDNMQFCLHFCAGQKDKVLKAYEVLKEGAIRVLPPDSCDWSPCVVGVVDRFGVNWCIFVSK